MDDAFNIEAYKAELGNRIMERRVHLRFSQEELAEMSDSTKQTISRAESGRQEPLAHNVLFLAKALGVSADFLLSGQITDVDRHMLVEKTKNLTTQQYRFLEDIVISFVGLCEAGQVK